MANPLDIYVTYEGKVYMARRASLKKYSTVLIYTLQGQYHAHAHREELEVIGNINDCNINTLRTLYG